MSVELSNQPQIFIPPLSFRNAQQEGATSIGCNPIQLKDLGYEVKAEGGRNLPADPAELAIVLWRHSIPGRDPHFFRMTSDYPLVYAGQLAVTGAVDGYDFITKKTLLESGRKVLEVEVGSWIGSLSGNVASALVHQDAARVHSLTNPKSWLQMAGEATMPKMPGSKRREIIARMQVKYPAALVAIAGGQPTAS